ncbi:MAG: glycosyltransferase [Melioribacteraceae bacterium]|nr:glycosyltransferase [Melioribacteraceae bacterium]
MVNIKILIVGYFQYEWYEEAWAKVLSELGYSVTRFNISNYYFNSFIRNLSLRKRLSYLTNTIEKSFIQHFEKVKPQITIFYKGYHFNSRVFKEVKYKTWITGYDNDDLFGGHTHWYVKQKVLKCLPYYDSYHCYREKNLSEYKSFISNVGLLRSYYLPWLHYPSSTQFTKNKRNDIVFIGHAEDDKRLDFIENLINNGYPLQLYGEYMNWARYLHKELLSKLPAPYPVYGDIYRKTINDSKICLSFFSNKNNDTYTRRVFEIPACGGFLLSTRTDTMKELYEEGKEAEFFSSKEELIDKIRYYLANGEVREKIAIAGYERCIKSGYDIYSRMKQWLHDIEKFRLHST